MYISYRIEKIDSTGGEQMKPIEFLAENLKSSFQGSKDFNIYDFLKVENVLYLLSVISPDLDPNNAYVLLRGYQIINHSKEDDELFLLQQARIKFLLYSSRVQWEQDFGLYLDKKYEGIRLYNVENNKLVKTKSSIPLSNREEKYLSNILSAVAGKSNLSVAKPGKHKFYKQDKSQVTVQIPDFPVYSAMNVNEKAKCSKPKRKKISIGYSELLNTALTMKSIVPTDHCYDVLQKNMIVNVRSDCGSNTFTINGMTNIVGMVGSGKTTLLRVISFYLAKHGYRTAIILNTVNEVVEMFRYFKEFKLSVSPLVGKLNQEKYVYSLLNGSEMFIDEDSAKYLTAPCILNGLSDESDKAWQFSERPCFNLRACDNEDKRSGKVRCAFFDYCPGAAMLREAEKSDIIVTTVAGLASSLIGENHRLFLEEIISDFDVVLFDECDRVQSTLDDFFAPNTSFNDFMRNQANACAFDMCKSYSDVNRDRNERKYFTLARETTQVYDEIVDDIKKISLAEQRGWNKIISTTFSALTLLRQMEKDGVSESLIYALRYCIRIEGDAINVEDFTSQLSELCDDSCRNDGHFTVRLKRLLDANKIYLTDKDFLHLQLTMKVIYFDRLMHRIDNAAKSVDKEILLSNNISDFLQARFASQQKYLPSAPMGNMFGMVYAEKEEELKVYRQFACGRYLMLSLPWLRVSECGEPLGPHTVLMSGSSYAPGSLQYHVNVPIDYVLRAPINITDYLNKSKFIMCGATTVISGGGQEGREERIKNLLREIRQHIEAELDRPGKILFVVNSYNEAKETMRYTKGLLAELNRKEKCAVVIGDDEERKEVGMLRKNDLQSFAFRDEKILIAPAAVICRGYNIVDRDGNAAVRSIFFLVRPMPVPDDITLKISKLNGYISNKFNLKQVSDWGAYSNDVKNEGGKFWGIMERDSGCRLSDLSNENKRDITASVFIVILQTYGRSVRVGNETTIDCYPPRIYFADGAFCDGRGEGSFDILREICAYLEDLMANDNNIATTLYGTFYNALKENINNESAKEIANDDFYSEEYHD